MPETFYVTVSGRYTQTLCVKADSKAEALEKAKTTDAEMLHLEINTKSWSTAKITKDI